MHGHQFLRKRNVLRGCGKTVLLAESLPQRLLKAAKQSKVLTAALKRFSATCYAVRNLHAERW
jgi:hypothetical protein